MLLELPEAYSSALIHCRCSHADLVTELHAAAAVNEFNRSPSCMHGTSMSTSATAQPSDGHIIHTLQFELLLLSAERKSKLCRTPRSRPEGATIQIIVTDE
jgi:hypothetical protein